MNSKNARDGAVFVKAKLKSGCKPAPVVFGAGDTKREALAAARFVEELEKFAIWCSGSADFQEGGKAAKGWARWMKRIEKLADRATGEE